MIEFIIIFIVVYGSVWAVRRSVNKRKWSDVSGKLPGGKPENRLVLTSSIADLESLKNKLSLILQNSDYKLAEQTANQFVLEDKKATVNPLNTMYFYPLSFSKDSGGQSRIEIGIADKSSFLGNKGDRMQKLQKLFNFLSTSLK